VLPKVDKYSSYYVPQVARIVNQNPAPLIVGDRPIQLIALSYFLQPTARLILEKGASIPHIPDNAGAVFLFHPSESLRRRFDQEQAYTMKAIHELGYLWHIEPQ
jgi:hypothetical protein